MYQGRSFVRSVARSSRVENASFPEMTMASTCHSRSGASSSAVSSRRGVLHQHQRVKTRNSMLGMALYSNGPALSLLSSRLYRHGFSIQLTSELRALEQGWLGGQGFEGEAIERVPDSLITALKNIQDLLLPATGR